MAGKKRTTIASVDKIVAGDAAAEFREDSPAIVDGGTQAILEEIDNAAAIETAPAEENAPRDSGMGAGFPYLEDLSNEPGLPVSEVPIPPQESMKGAPLFSAAAYFAPGPVEGMPGSVAPVQEAEQEYQQEMIDFFITDERLNTLWERANQAKEGVEARVQSLQIARTLLDLIKNARNELIAGRNRYEEAERLINEVEYRVEQNERMRYWSYRLGPFLFIYEIAWMVVLGWIFFARIGGAAFISGTDYLVYMGTSIICGGLGGVVGALFALIKHISQDQDFDRQHTMWYINSPVMGLIMGFVMALIVRLLTIVETSPTMATPIFLYVFSWLVGYQHNVFTDYIKKVIKVIDTSSNSSGKEE